MKAKVLDPKRYYTFDLFEEYLFNEVIELYSIFREIGDDREEEIKPSMTDTMETLIKTYGLDEDEASEIAESVWKPEKMGIEESALFFGDDDFSIVFQDGFVHGIRSLVSGFAGILGYSYDDVCAIFTDAGIKVPMLLVGTKAAFDTEGELAQEDMAEFTEWLMGGQLPRT